MSRNLCRPMTPCSRLCNSSMVSGRSHGSIVANSMVDLTTVVASKFSETQCHILSSKCF
uniref:Uncharacterized protein n=1 Tax=Arundo donax TaxID=35708 RepID=A0A0A9CE87_ARUDO